jgi:hypothetical protein
MAEITYNHNVLPFGRNRADAQIQARAAANALSDDIKAALLAQRLEHLRMVKLIEAELRLNHGWGGERG